MVGYLRYRKKNSTKYVVSPAWASNTCIEIFVSSDMYPMEKKEAIAPAQGKLLKKVKGSENLEISWWRTFADFLFRSSKKANARKPR